MDNDLGRVPLAPGSREWRRVPVSPYRNYEVSSDGKVRRGIRELAGIIDTYGYHTVRLSYAGLSKRFKVHRLVCEAFHGTPPDKADAAHIDGSRTNNRAENLRWATRKENMADKRRHGTSQTGERGPGVKLTRQQVDAIRAREASGERRPALAREFGVARGHLRRIIIWEAWK